MLDVMVVGAGQAGLAAGFHLQRTPLSHRLFDRAARVGDSWRRRYDSLVLFSTRAYCALPGLPMDGDPNGYPGKDEVAEYLDAYARTIDLPISLGEGIARVERDGGAFVALTDGRRRIATRALIVAAGAFQRSAIPVFAHRLSQTVQQLAADSYRNPQQVQSGRVLVVGGGATGRQIARELADSHEVSLSTGRPVSITPQRVLGRDVMAWFHALGFLRADKDTAIGRFVRSHESFPGLHLSDRALLRHGVHLRQRVVDADGDSCRFANGSSDRFDAVIWAIGYRDDTSWLRIDGAVDSTGMCLERRGVSPVPGLFYVGRSWQRSRASALLCGVAADAADIVERVSGFVAASDLPSSHRQTHNRRVGASG
jgi:putative flavoprotein involved in K+ transport